MYFLVEVHHITLAPNGVKANLAILKNCLPKGMPIIVTQHISPSNKFSKANGIPEIINQNKLAIVLIAPPPYTTRLPNGQNDKPANLKHCMPIGIPMMVIHHNIPAASHDSPLIKPPHINHKILPIKFISLYSKLYLLLFHGP